MGINVAIIMMSISLCYRFLLYSVSTELEHCLTTQQYKVDFAASTSMTACKKTIEDNLKRMENDVTL